MSDIPAAVVEIEAADTVRGPARAARGRERAQRRATRHATARADRPGDTPSPPSVSCSACARRRVEAQSTLVRASLEDVFVAATGFGRDAGDEPDR